jgi:hypothetical protein
MKAFRILIALWIAAPLSLMAQSGINGEGDVVKQEIQLETITGIDFSFAGDVILTQGSPQRIVMEGQQNILDNIKREVRNGVWHAEFDKNVRNAKPVKITITLAKLTDVAVSGSGNVSTTNTFTGLAGVDAAIAGSGEIDLSIQATDVEAAISGSGNIKLSGSASSVEIAISGSGNVHAEEMKTGDCEVAISGSGDALVHCTGSLETAISGSGDVRYKGDAPKIRASVSGSGNVTEID